jgi:hypothetical protein
MDPIVLIPITLIFVVVMIVGRNEIVKRRLTCPHKGTPADIEVLRRSLSPGTILRAKSCSLLPDPNKVDCGQECLKQVV